MTELQVTLEFACCACEQAVHVTVKCAAKGLAETSQAVATVHVPCPHCGDVNDLMFEPNGRVRNVALHRSPLQLLVPSVN